MSQKDNQPPKRAAQLLEFFADRFGMQEIAGDIYEVFSINVAEKPFRAKITFWIDSMLAIPMMWATRARRKKPQASMNPFSMFLSNIKIGFRHILKKPGYSFSTIFGLMLAVLSCMIIVYYVRFEKSFDQYHEKIDRIAVVYYHYFTADIDIKSPGVPDFVGPKLIRTYPEVERQSRLLPLYGSRVLARGDRTFEETSIAYVDSAYFDLFSFELIQGDHKGQLARPYTMVLSESAAHKYFGSDDPIGKTLTISGKRDYEITGLIEDVPKNSHYRADFFIAMSTLKLEEKETWDSPNYITYLELSEGTDLASLQSKVNASWLAESKELALEIHPLAELHFDTSISPYVINITDERYLTLFLVIAVIIVVMGCINYINLITARASERGKEVGVRKVSGATMGQLFFQFMTDALLHILPAIVLSVALFFLALPVIQNLLGLNVAFVSNGDKLYILKLALVILVFTTFIAGLYPAVIMARFNPGNTLKGRFQSSPMARHLRKALVVVQFTVSIMLMVGALVITQQLSFMQNSKLGYDKEHTMILPADASLIENFNAFKTELKKVAGVEHVIPVSTAPSDVVIGYGAALKEDQVVTVGALRTNADFLPGMDIDLVGGRNFSEQTSLTEDRDLQFIVNETFLIKFNISQQEALGTRMWLGWAGGEGTIIGVMRDFHTSTLHSKIEPVVLFDRGEWVGKFLIRVAPGNPQETIAAVEAVHKQFAPHKPFNFSFLDDHYQSKYMAEIKFSRLVSIFSSLAVVIACLGILGLAAYAAAQRSKEIGVRKVMGASSGSIAVLVGKEFVLLIAVAFCLAAPLAYHYSTEWLNNFHYRIDISILHFAIAGVLAIGFALLAIGYQTLTAANLSPAETLKAE